MSTVRQFDAVGCEMESAAFGFGLTGSWKCIGFSLAPRVSGITLSQTRRLSLARTDQNESPESVLKRKHFRCTAWSLWHRQALSPSSNSSILTA